MSMKNFNETIGNRTRDLPACSAVPQPTAPPRATDFLMTLTKFSLHKAVEIINIALLYNNYVSHNLLFFHVRVNK